MSDMVFEGAARWKGGNESDLRIKGNIIATVSPPPEFGGKGNCCAPEEVFAASLASCMNTIFLLVGESSNLELNSLETKASVTMNVVGFSFFSGIHFIMNVGLKQDNDNERAKVQRIYKIAQKSCPLSHSWGEDVPITFSMNFV
jgi:organic hydroperoxide reductase OsmC/OhrA